MDTIKYLLSKILFLIPMILLLMIFYWAVTKLIPDLPKSLNLSNLSFKTFSLPAPGSFGPLLGNINTPVVQSKTYVAGKAYNENINPNTTYATYDSKGNIIYKKGWEILRDEQQNNTNVSESTVPKELYIRNLSIYKNGHIYTGLSFTGEARSTMFNNGIFPVFITDSTGKVISVEKAEAQTQWSVPGWIRFNVKIVSNLPIKTQCALIFRPETGSKDFNKQIQVVVPEICN